MDIKIIDQKIFKAMNNTNLTQRHEIKENLGIIFEDKKNLEEYLEENLKKKNLLDCSKKIINLNLILKFEKKKFLIEKNLFDYYKKNYEMILKEKENFCEIFLKLIFKLRDEKEIFEILEIFGNLTENYFEEKKFDLLDLYELIKIQLFIHSAENETILKMKNFIIKVNLIIYEKTKKFENLDFLKKQKIDLLIDLDLYYNVFIFERSKKIEEIIFEEKNKKKYFSILEKKKKNLLYINLKKKKFILYNLKILKKKKNRYNFYLKIIFELFKKKKNNFIENNFLKNNFKILTKEMKKFYIEENFDNFEKKDIDIQIEFLKVYTNDYIYDLNKKKKLVEILKKKFFLDLREKNFLNIFNKIIYFLNFERKNDFYDNENFNKEFFLKFQNTYFEKLTKFKNDVDLKDFFCYFFYTNLNFLEFEKIIFFYLNFLENIYKKNFNGKFEFIHILNINMLISKDFILYKSKFLKNNKILFEKIFFKIYNNLLKMNFEENNFVNNIFYQFLLTFEFILKNKIFRKNNFESKKFFDLKKKILEKIKKKKKKNKI